MLANRIVIQAVFFLALLLWAAVIDIRTRTIPDCLNLLIVLTVFLGFQPVNLLGILTALPFFCAAMTCGGMGGGDIKMMAACGLVLGLPFGLMAEMLGCFSCFCIMLGIAVCKGSEARRWRKHFR